ncbi:MAG: zinc-ribbon domain-containing protein, partial [Anaerolineae bacterium]
MAQYTYTCPRCGAQNPQQASRCESCGHSLGQLAAAPEQAPAAYSATQSGERSLLD